jgi:site-specific DNA-methyltransferase (adenine-specific)
MHIVKSNFQFVPVQDFSESWTDEKLYKKYGLNKNEISYIENKIRPMD